MTNTLIVYQVLAAVLLHDVVEDTDVTIDEVKEKFGKQVAEILRGAIVLDKLEKKAIEKESSWIERKEHTIHFYSMKPQQINYWFLGRIN